MRTKLSKTKNKIIHVAKSLFSEMSVYKATMNDIAQAANMSRRTLYMHFKSKEEIYHYVVEDHVKDINEKLQKAADSALPPDRKLKLYILARFNVSTIWSVRTNTSVMILFSTICELNSCVRVSI